MPNVIDLSESNIRVRLGKEATPFISEISALIRSTFDGHDVPLPNKALMEACQKKNPATFVVVQPRWGSHVCCAIEMYPIREKPLNSLLLGEVSEADLKIEDMFSLEDSVAGGLYVAITCPSRGLNSRNDLNILAAIDGAIEVLGRCYVGRNVSTINLFALDATPEGQKLLTSVFKNLFEPLNVANGQRAQRNLEGQAWRGRYDQTFGEKFRDTWRITPSRFPFIQDW